ncbi:nucleoside 2-deoxyribosyltransferase domain-containing protein [Flavivirga amylovorans]|uniref:Nucleoside 2-deoxyribosyltransferase domain-containing protein n=1 Tax=Flavivirga amylovorans TaxID=870486 RepID=A0ABT8WZI7_9FLAO|nr:nucleoside 2-deoxyribosyltransferase domain-containing protein [Flavivirga amylovorans]MDO5987092.1 nucleoside 2-deoxyribosyltransferase domain-containing protein [Flavivirga amylovorans]
MIYTSSITLPIKEKHKNYIFLAGSIDLNLPSNWRKEVIDIIGAKAHFLDPTIINHNELNDSQMKNHIHWELDALHLADKVFLNFLPSSKSPISLIELGMYIKTSKLVVVCPNEFYQSRYIKTLCNKYKVSVFNSLSIAVNSIL